MSTPEPKVEGYNRNNRGVKRLLQEFRAIQQEPSEQYTAKPLDDNLFEWHFTIRGPPQSSFEGGIYHGRIIFPVEYPFKPPAIMMSTPNGRFEVNKKICLSISNYHPEHWQPCWSIRTVLVALRAFLPTKGEGAVGSVESSHEDRVRLARLSLRWCCPSCGGGGVPNAVLLPPTVEEDSMVTSEKALAEEKAAMQICFTAKPENNQTENSNTPPTTPTTPTQTPATPTTPTQTPATPTTETTPTTQTCTEQNTAPPPQLKNRKPKTPQTENPPTEITPTENPPPPVLAEEQIAKAKQQQQKRKPGFDMFDFVLVCLLVLLGCAVAVLLAKKATA